MKRTSKLIISTLSVLALSGCGLIGAQTEEGETSDTVTEDGVTTSAFDPDSTETKSLSAAEDSAVAGASIDIAPGSLAVATEISIEEGGALADEDLSDTLGLTEKGGLEGAGPSVAISSSELINATEPMTLAIPLDVASLNLAEKFMVVIYIQVDAETGKRFVGMIPTKELEISGDKVTFKTTYFGVYQAAFIAFELTEPVQQETKLPIIRKSKATEMSGKWRTDCVDDKESHTGPDGQVYEDNRSYRMAMLVDDKNVYIKREEFNALGCKGEMHRILVEFEYKLGAEVEGTDGAKELDLTTTDMLFVITSPEMVTELNKMKLCGKSDYKLGDHISQKECDFDSELHDDKGPDYDQGPDGTSGTTTAEMAADGTANLQNADGTTEQDMQPTDTATNDSNDYKDDCDHGPEVGKTIYAIVKVTDTYLALGVGWSDEEEEEMKDHKDECGSEYDPDNRPTKLAPEGSENYFRKI